MVAKVISGREVAENILTTDLKNKVIELNKKNIKPKLIVVLVGDMKASASYVAQKEKFAVKAGIESDVMRFESSVTESKILDQIDIINKNKNIHVVIIAKKINQTTDGGIPVAKGVPSVLKAIKFIEPSQVNNHLKVSVAKIHAIGSFSIKTLRPGT